MEISKICKKCGIKKPIDQFDRLKRADKGYRAQCKECVKLYNDCKSYVYFIQQGDSGPIKIGFSKNGWRTRLSTLQVGNPYELSMIKCIKGDLQTEAKIHSEFSKFKIQGEWFKPVPSLLRFIKGLKYYTHPEFDKDMTQKVKSVDILLDEYAKFEDWRNKKSITIKNKWIPEKIKIA